MSDTKLPSEVLGTQFELPDAVVVSDTGGDELDAFHGHGFRIGDLGLLLLTENTVCEVSDQLQLCQLPNTAPWLYGITNQRGNMVPVFDLALLLGFAREQSNKKPNMLIYDQKDAAVGMLIEELPVRMELGADERMGNIPPLPERLQSFVRACYRYDNTIWVNWDVHGLFASLSDQIAA